MRVHLALRPFYPASLEGVGMFGTLKPHGCGLNDEARQDYALADQAQAAGQLLRVHPDGLAEILAAVQGAGASARGARMGRSQGRQSSGKEDG